MSIRHLKVSDFSFVHVVILIFIFCADYSIAYAGQLPEKTASINLTTEEKAWLKEHPEITIAHTFDWPPYSFLDSNIQPVGPSIDFFEIVAEMVGLKFKVHEDGLWNRILEAGKNKEVDIVASMAITKERKQWFSFPRPYLFLSSYIVTRKDFQKIKHRDDLKGKQLSGAKGTWQNDDVLKNYPSVAIDFVDTYSDALLEVSTGKVDATVVTLGSALYEIAQKSIYNLKLAAVYEKNTELITFGVRKDWPELVSIIDKALAAIPEATKIQIINKWMPPLENQTLSGPILTKEEQAWITEKHSVRVRVPHYPPYFITKKDSAPEGIAIEYLNLISERTGLKLNYSSSDRTFSEALEGLKKHQGPDLFALLKPTLERQREILFSKEYLKSPYVIFTHTDETHIITGIDEMLSKTIALPQGTAIYAKVQKDYPNITLLPFDSDFEAIEAVATKKADAYIGDLTVASYFILEEGLYNVKIAAPSPFGDQLFSIGSRNDWPELASIIEKGLASITPEEQQKIRNKYFSIHYERGVSWVDILKWGGGAAGIVFFAMSVFVYWNRKLKVEIIERKHAEMALVATKEKAERYLNLAGVMFIGLDEQGNVNIANSKACEILGYNEKDVVGRNWFNNFIPTNIRDNVYAVFEQLIAGDIEPVEYYENIVLSKSGKEKDIAWHNTFIREENGKISGILGSGEDITDRKRTEKALLESEERLRNVFTNSPFPIMVHAEDGRVVMINETWTQLTGYSHADIPTITDWTEKAYGENKEEVAGLIKPLYALKERSDEGEFSVRTRDGSTVIWDFSSAALGELPNGQKLVVSMAKDVTDQKHAAEEQQKMEVKLQQSQKMESIGTLAGGIAHDFNNILAAILGYAEMAKDDSQPGSSVSKDLDEVLEAGHRAKSLVRQILAFSRQDNAERIHLQPASIIKETITLLRPSLPTTIDITQDIDAVTGLVFVDPTQLNQILMNLCTNAFHAMEETGGKLGISLKEVTLSSEDLIHEPNVADGTFIQFSISDSGPGVAPNIKGKIFEPYFTTKGVGKGTGMGLATVHGIVKSYGGFITLYSELGEGTVFHVFLPTVEARALSGNEINGQAPVGKERVLFVDDEEILATMGKTMLERLGYHVTVRNNSLEALETFQNQPDTFDIVITDQTMPGMTGSDLSRRMLQIRPDIPIILCTGYSTIISEEKAKSMGIKEFAFKPLAKKDIAKLIRKVLDVS